MAQFSIDINDEMCPTVWDAFAFRFRYDEKKLEDETKQQFTRRMVIGWIKEVTTESTADIVAMQARAAERENVAATLVVQ